MKIPANGNTKDVKVAVPLKFFEEFSNTFNTFWN